MVDESVGINLMVAYMDLALYWYVNLSLLIFSHIIYSSKYLVFSNFVAQLIILFIKIIV